MQPATTSRAIHDVALLRVDPDAWYRFGTEAYEVQAIAQHEEALAHLDTQKRVRARLILRVVMRMHNISAYLNKALVDTLDALRSWQSIPSCPPEKLAEMEHKAEQRRRDVVHRVYANKAILKRVKRWEKRFRKGDKAERRQLVSQC